MAGPSLTIYNAFYNLQITIQREYPRPLSNPEGNFLIILKSIYFIILSFSREQSGVCVKAEGGDSKGRGGREKGEREGHLGSEVC